MHFHVAGYSISPCPNAWVEKDEAEFIAGLCTLPFVAGLELPHLKGLDRWNEEFLFRHADPAWSFVATALPSTSQALRRDAAFGLSADANGPRRAAIDTLADLRDAVRSANDRLGRRAIRAVEIPSGSSGGRLAVTSSSASFANSLAEIGGWDWDGALLVVEHCDTALPGQEFEKGFLSVEEEIEAVRAANGRLATPIGMSLNWGRSAIEGRGADAPLQAQHAQVMQGAGLLRGMIFSGASGADTAYGAWKDTHMPPAGERYVRSAAAGSLLTEAEMRKFFAATQATELAFVGLKIAIRPVDAPVAARIALLRDALTILASTQLADA